MPSSPDTTADQLALLLSTDWFLPHWNVIGIVECDKSAFQHGCRNVVQRFMGTASDYYLVIFTEDRIAGTRQQLQREAESLSSSSQAKIKELCIPRTRLDELRATAWMFHTVFEDLATDSRLDLTTRERLKDAQLRFAFPSEALKRVCAESQSEWDIWIRHLTPDLPCSLADFVTVGLLPELQFTFVYRGLTDNQRESLMARYKSIASAATGLLESEILCQLPST